jgi:hypothetical protein
VNYEHTDWFYDVLKPITIGYMHCCIKRRSEALSAPLCSLSPLGIKGARGFAVVVADLPVWAQDIK